MGIIKNWWPTILVVGIGCALMTKSCCAGEFRRLPQCSVSSDSDIRIKHYVQQAEYHKSKALRAYKEAEGHVWYLPNESEKSIAIKCFKSAIATVGCATPTGKLVTAILVFFVEYGVDVIDEFYFIKECLELAEYNFWMYEYYSHLAEVENG